MLLPPSLSVQRILLTQHRVLYRARLQSSPCNRVFTTFTGLQQQQQQPPDRHRRPLKSFCYTVFAPPEVTCTSSFKLADSSTTRDYSGHNHSHSHSHSHGLGHHHHHGVDPFLTSNDKTDPGVRITRVGLYVNLAMVVSKGIGGWVFNSQALIADAFHALTDMVSDIMTLATVSFALKKPTKRFPNGYGKIESLGSLGVSSLLLLGGVAMGYGSLLHLLGDFFPTIASYLPHVHAHNHSHGIPSIHAAWFALASIGTKEWLYRKTMQIAKQKKSTVLASNAVHHRIDSLTSIVALLAIAGSNILPTAAWLDPVGGLLVAVMVVQAGIGNTKTALYELADAGIDEEVKQEVAKKLATSAAGQALISIDGIKSGQNYLLTITAAVDGDKTLGELEMVEDMVRSSLADVPGMWRVQVRFVKKGVEPKNEFVKLYKKQQ